MDNWSEGVDSATPRSITRSLVHLARKTKTPVIISMQAPDTDVFNNFDVVCCLGSAKVMYSGPREEAEHWFKSIGFSRLLHRSEPDLSATICDPSFRHKYILKHTGSSTPRNVHECARCFAACSIAEEVRRAMDQDVGGTPPGQEKEVSVEPSPRLAKVAKRKSLQNLWRQSKILVWREAKLMRAKRSKLLSSFLRNVVFGIVLGSIFWQLPTTQEGASTRAGLLFLALLFIGLSSLSALAAKHAEKASDVQAAVC